MGDVRVCVYAVEGFRRIEIWLVVIMFHPFFWLLQVAQETGRVQMKDTRYVYCDGRILRTSVWKKFAYIYNTVLCFFAVWLWKSPGESWYISARDETSHPRGEWSFCSLCYSYFFWVLVPGSHCANLCAVAVPFGRRTLVRVSRTLQIDALSSRWTNTFMLCHDLVFFM